MKPASDRILLSCFSFIASSLRGDMARIVPQPNYRRRLIVFIAECAQAGRGEKEVFSPQWLQAEPAGGEHAEEMAAGKKQHVAVDRTNAVNHLVGSGRDFGRRLTAGTAVAKELPI